MATIDEYPLLFFGYGSLMFPDGLEGRGMRKVYSKDDFIPYMIEGFTRQLNAHYAGLRYYGIKTNLANKDSKVIGTLFQIDNKEDMYALLENEYAYPAIADGSCMYYLMRITNKVVDTVRQGREVFTLVTANPTEIGVVPGKYVDYCWEGIQIWGEGFCDAFVQTGGMYRGKHAVKRLEGELSSLHTAK